MVRPAMGSSSDKRAVSDSLADNESPLLLLPSFSATAWQMSFGERAIIEGVLAQLRPRLALEIGTAEGGSLKAIATHSERVISFDLVEPQAEARALENVELRTGDSHVLLEEELHRIAERGENVDFVLVDGDHSADGAREDVEDLLASSALESTVILAHDTLNQEVRRGLEEVRYSEIDKVGFVDLDFIGGYVPSEPPLRGECWGGLGLIVVDGSGSFARAHKGRRAAMTPLSELIWPTAESIRNGQSADGGPQPSSTSSELEQHRAAIEEIKSSLSWRLTAPLRAARARFGRR
jgi:hypothetical protein